MLYTRPQLPPLGLDLAEPEAAAQLGRIHSQFDVTTSDNRALQIKYRGGRLLITSENNTQTLLDAKIGPPANAICLEQICDLTGMTIGGKPVTLPETKRRTLAEQALVLDWSGRTSYFECPFYATEDDGQKFLQALRDVFPGVYLLNPVWNDTFNRGLAQMNSVTDAKEGAIIGIGFRGASLPAMLAQKHVALYEIEDAFEQVINFALRPDIFRAKDHNKPIAEYPQAAFADYLGGRIATRFINNNPKDQAFRERFLALWATYFTNILVNVDLQTGIVVDQMETPIWVSQSIAAWCKAEPYRFLYATKEKASGERGHFGRRPA